MSDLQQRYGTPSKSRRRTLIVVSSLVSALFLGWLIWVIVDKSDPAARVELAAWDVIDDQHVWIRVAAKFRDAQETEEEHLELVRTWILEATLAGEPARAFA